MKKIYASLFAACFSLAIPAQTYYPMLDTVNAWQYTTNYLPVRLHSPVQAASNCSYPVWFVNTMVEQTTGDSVIGSYTYKRVEISPDLNTTYCLLGFVREDTATRRVYFLDNLGNPEIVLYDFGMQIGDTIPISFTMNSGYYESGTYRLDSITTVYIHAGARRAFHLSNQTVLWPRTLTWIESVGALTDAFYTVSGNQLAPGSYYANCSVSPHDCSQFMTCFDHLTKIYYDSCALAEAQSNSCIQYLDTCNYWNICGAVPELQAGISFELSPVPSSGKVSVNIECAEATEATLVVYDLYGRESLRTVPAGLLSRGRHEINLDLSTLPDGIYLLELHGKNGSVSRKLLLQR